MTDPTDSSTPPVKRRFSERIEEVVVAPQVRSMNFALRSSLWNLMRDMIPTDSAPSAGVAKSQAAVEALTANVLRWPIERIDGRTPRWWLAHRVQEIPWYTVYELLEFMADNITLFQTRSGGVSQEAFRKTANEVLQRENAGYRFVASVLTEVTSPAEIEAIEKAMTETENYGLGTVHTHIKQALQLLGQRPEPDFRNAIKEAISAVESAVNLIQGAKKMTLDPALDLLDKRFL